MGGARLATIRDERTGEPCNYLQLAAEVRQLMESAGLAWRAAANRVAEIANSDKADSIVRNLNRYKEPRAREHTSGVQPAGASIAPGIGGLVPHIRGRVGTIKADIEGRRFVPDEDCAAYAEELRGFRMFLERRREGLTAFDPAQASAEFDRIFGSLPIQLNGWHLVREEMAAIDAAISVIRHLQLSVDTRRKNPTFRDF